MQSRDCISGDGGGPTSAVSTYRLLDHVGRPIQHLRSRDRGWAGLLDASIQMSSRPRPHSPPHPHTTWPREKVKRDSLVGTSGVWCSHPLRDRLVYVYYGRTCRCKAVPVRRALGSLAARVTAQDANKRAHRTAIAHILIQTAIPHTGILCAARLDHRRSTFLLLCHRPQRVTGPLIVEFTHSSPLSRQYACPFVSCSSLKIFFIRSL